MVSTVYATTVVYDKFFSFLRDFETFAVFVVLIDNLMHLLLKNFCFHVYEEVMQYFLLIFSR